MFHECSKYVYDWLSRQNHVKEESITDWLLYEISQKCDFIFYQAFSRHEESQNGSDWEWWVLVKDSSKIHKFNAYRFLIQAKKLLPCGGDNYPLIAYSNKNGTQVDLLINSANNRNALPLYMYYSIGKTDIAEQIMNLNHIPEDILRWCSSCTNGCYLSLANIVYDLLYNVPRTKILDSKLLNSSFKLSMLDWFCDFGWNDVDIMLNDLNGELLNKEIVYSRQYINYGIQGIKHNERSIPKYLNVFLQSKNDKLDWFEEEMNMTDISGLGVIDLRQDYE